MNRAQHKRLMRIAKAQSTILDAAQKRHHMLKSEYDKAVKQTPAIVDALSDTSPLHGLLVPLMASALKQSAADVARIEHALTKAASTAARERIRCDALYGRAAVAERQTHRGVLKLTLEEAIGRASASARKSER